MPEQSKSSIEIVSQNPLKGLGRKYVANAQWSEEGYVEVGVIVRNDDGDPIKDTIVEMKGTDESQNRTRNGSSSSYEFYENGVKNVVPFYPFHYEFKTAGKHTITFTANGMITSVDLDVADPEQQ